MAIQAQYPSNVFHLNRKVNEDKGQIGNNYLIQPQSGGLDQSQMIFSNGVGPNPRKRGRDFTERTPALNPSQFIDLTQLNTSHPNAVSTGLRLAFSDHQQLQQQQQQQKQQNLFPQSSVLVSPLSEDFTTQIRQQRDEIDLFLQAQGEELRRTLAEKRQRHDRALLEVAELSVARRLREVEMEVEKAARRNGELEATAAQLNAESQAWQARARAQEATAGALQEQLQQAIMYGGQRQDTAEELAAEDAESAYNEPDRVVVTSGLGCKACRRRVASVVMLPCRHLCLCTECGPLAQACPLCLSFKDSTIEVFLC